MEEAEKLLKQLEWSDEELMIWLSHIQHEREVENEMAKMEEDITFREDPSAFLTGI